MRPLLTLLIPGVIFSSCAKHDLAALPETVSVELPADHAPHDFAQTEWWHVHADLEDLATGEMVSVFAGFIVERTDLDRAAGIPVGPFVNPFHVAMVQVQTRDRTWTADRESFPDLLAARFVPPRDGGEGLDLRHGDWRIRWEHGALLLDVGAQRHDLKLKLVPTRAITLPGDGGRVELRPGSAHVWNQYERMEVSGRWRDGLETRWVEGTGFYKHEWGRMYDDDYSGFQWVSMDLPDGRSLSVAWLTEDGETGVEGSAAWVSTPEGVTEPLPIEELSLEATRTWRSRRSSTHWPVQFQLTGAGLDLEISALRDDQELWTFPTSMYVGPARAVGTVDGAQIDIPAFVEQAGARRTPLRFFLRSDAPPPLEGVADAQP